MFFFVHPGTTYRDKCNITGGGWGFNLVKNASITFTFYYSVVFDSFASSLQLHPAGVSVAIGLCCVLPVSGHSLLISF